MKMRQILFMVGAAMCWLACTPKQEVDLMVHNATIYTVDSAFTTAEAMVIKNGKIVATGTRAELENTYKALESLDAQNQFVYPGFIDAHAHFIGYAEGLTKANLVGTKSWTEILGLLEDFATANPEGWLLGRGWDQNDWEIKNFPGNDLLNQLFPDRPVLLTRIDGHAAIANQKALELAGVKAGDKMVGGEVEVKNGRLTGILIDNAIDLVSAQFSQITTAQLEKAIGQAQENCFAVGLTTIDDCGLNYSTVEHIQSLHESGALKMRMYVMLSDLAENFDYLEKTGKIKTDRLNVRSFKVYGDGALGSRGACLIEPYSDKPGHYGFLLSTVEHFDSVAARISANGFQMCTHAIGDQGNRTILNVYNKYLKGKNDLRWRIEHAQVVNEADFHLFGESSVIPSVQPTHATSDMYWATDRLGPDRVKGAYAYKKLLKENGWIPLGTDFPVEDISPLKTFYAAVVRKDGQGWPEEGYQLENSLSREEALRGMTIWAAKSNFEEGEKGSLEVGKFADFVLLDQDLMKTEDSKLLNVKVVKTFLNGEKVWENK